MHQSHEPHMRWDIRIHSFFSPLSSLLQIFEIVIDKCSAGPRVLVEVVSDKELVVGTGQCFQSVRCVVQGRDEHLISVVCLRRVSATGCKAFHDLN